MKDAGQRPGCWDSGAKVDHMDAPWTVQALINTGLVQVVHGVHVKLKISNMFGMNASMCFSHSLV